MAAYISRDSILEKLKAKFCDYCPLLDCDTNCKLHYLLDAVKEEPAADVRPVVRGIWQETEEPMGWTDVSCACCSACVESFVLGEYEFSDFTEIFNFCPNCGADMREKAE
jgi:hypothetical protein